MATNRTYPFEHFQFKAGNLILYSAGSPSFPADFTRDTLIAGLLARDPTLLHDQLLFCSQNQGAICDPQSGEEPGKIHHEIPPAEMRGLSTLYNACDTTALYLFGMDIYERLTHDRAFITTQNANIEKAVAYILQHLKSDLFTEDPAYCGGTAYALQVTYWKDSYIPVRQKGDPVYPIVYSLVQAQNIQGLRSAGRLLKQNNLYKRANAMVQALMQLFDEDFQTFPVGIDQEGMIKGVSSDALHMLFYLQLDDIAKDIVDKIAHSAKVLETKLGYRTLSPDIASLTTDKKSAFPGYHTRAVWPFEQALIHLASRKFNLTRVTSVCARIASYLDTYPELFIIEGEEFKKSGTTEQLWTVAAGKYFDNPNEYSFLLA